MAITKTTVLVTGASGFLGSHILKALTSNAGVSAIAACRRRDRLDPDYTGEVRVGDLQDPGYRREVVRHVDVVCHAGTWASMWNHAEAERRNFYQPACDLIEQAIDQGVKRFIMASTVAIGARATDDRALMDDTPPAPTGFWPHLDRLIDVDRFMRSNAQRGTQMITLRLGHFVGVGNRLGLVPALAPRLRTYLVPWLAGGRKRLPLVADSDLGQAFACASLAQGLDDYESFNICGTEYPTLREVVQFIAAETGLPQPLYSVPFSAGYAFGWLMEKLHPVLPGSSPFLTRSIVHLCENWVCPNDYAHRKLGYAPVKTWRTAMREHLADLRRDGYPWPRLCQPVSPSTQAPRA